MGNSTVSDARNITLVMDFYELTMSYDYFKQGKRMKLHILICSIERILIMVVMSSWQDCNS